MSQLEKNIWGPGFCAFLYLIVHFIPDFGGADVMGSQWLYVSLVDFAILSYILFNQQTSRHHVLIAVLSRQAYYILIQVHIYHILGESCDHIECIKK